MSAPERTLTPDGIPAATLHRILDEGYGPGAWYGAGMHTAIADVTPAAAFKRPAPGRHNVAEVTLHHAWWLREARRRLTGVDPGAFPLEGEDWFALADASVLAWPQVVATLADEQRQLVEAVSRVSAGVAKSPLTEGERFDLILGITGHAAYHAGQVQLIKLF